MNRNASETETQALTTGEEPPSSRGGSKRVGANPPDASLPKRVRVKRENSDYANLEDDAFEQLISLPPPLPPRRPRPASGSQSGVERGGAAPAPESDGRFYSSTSITFYSAAQSSAFEQPRTTSAAPLKASGSETPRAAAIPHRLDAPESSSSSHSKSKHGPPVPPNRLADPSHHPAAIASHTAQVPRESSDARRELFKKARPMNGIRMTDPHHPPELPPLSRKPVFSHQLLSALQPAEWEGRNSPLSRTREQDTIQRPASAPDSTLPPSEQGFFSCSFCSLPVTRRLPVARTTSLADHEDVLAHLNWCRSIGVAREPVLLLFKAGNDLGDGGAAISYGPTPHKDEVRGLAARTDGTPSGAARGEVVELGSPPEGEVLEDMEVEEVDDGIGQIRPRKPAVAVVAKKGKGRAKKGAKNVSVEDARRNTEPNLFIQVHGDPSLFPCVSYLVDPLVDEPSRPLRPVSTMHHSKAHHIVSSHAFVIPHHVVDARGTLEVGLGCHALSGPTKAAEML
ncbi:hypothetical protein RQP46_001778 [Phenoliferia psychrophenolica]